MNVFRKLKSLLNKEKLNISYSQSGEDLIVDFIFRNLLSISKPTFIDVGANHPINFNNTYYFYKKGARGINIDPNKDSHKLLESFRKYDVNLNFGIGCEEGERTLFKFTDSMFNTFDFENTQFNGEVLSSESLPILTLTEVVKKYSETGFPDFLSLDTEGMDLEILESLSYDDFVLGVPKVICVESIKKIGANRWEKDFEVIDFLKSKKYIHHSDTFINSIFVHPFFLKVELT